MTQVAEQSPSTVSKNRTAAAATQPRPSGTLTLHAPEVPPNPVVYYTQATYPLNRVDFDALTRSQSPLTGFGVTVVAFALGHLLPFALTAAEKWEEKQEWITTSSKAGAGVLAVGLVLMGLGYIANRDKARIRKHIKKHFNENPGQHTLNA